MYIARNLHPMLKYPIQAITRRDMFSGREFERFPGENVEMFGIPMTPDQRAALRNVRYLNDLDRLNILDIPQMKVAMDAVPRGQIPGERSVLPSWVAAATSSFAPVPVRAYQVDIEEELRRQIGRAHV